MVLRQVIQDDPKNPRSLNGDVPRDLETICQKAMQKEPAGRYQTAGALADDLNRWLRGEPIQARPVKRLERSVRWCRRNPITAGLVATIAGLLVIGACSATAMYAKERRSRMTLEDALLDNNRLLSKAYVERTNRYMDPVGPVDEYTPLTGLPWLMAAHQVDESDPGRREASRLRLGTALKLVPSVEKIWFHPGKVSMAAASSDGAWLFTAGDDGTGRLWKYSDDKAERRPLMHPAAVTAAAFSPDNKLLLTGCATVPRGFGTPPATGWSPDPCSPRSPNSRSLPGAESARSVSAVMGDSLQRAAFKRLKFGKLASSDSSARRSPSGFHQPRWSSRIGTRFWPLPVPMVRSCSGIFKRARRNTGCKPLGGPRQSQPFPRTEQRLPGPPVRKPWRCGTADPARSLSARRSFTTARSLRSGFRGTVISWRPGRWMARSFFGTHTMAALSGNVGSLRITSGESISPIMDPSSSSRRAVGLKDRRLTVLDTESGDLIAEPIALPGVLRSENWVGQADLLATSSVDGTVRLWRTESDEAAVALPHSSDIGCAALTDDRRLLATVDDEGICCLVRLPSDQAPSPEMARFPTNITQPLAAALTADRKLLAVSDRKSNVLIFDLATRRILRRMESSRPGFENGLHAGESPSDHCLEKGASHRMESGWGRSNTAPAARRQR